MTLKLSRRPGSGIVVNDELVIITTKATRLLIDGPQRYRVRRTEHEFGRPKSTVRRLLYDDSTGEFLYCEVLWTEASKQEAEARLDLQDAAREV